MDAPLQPVRISGCGEITSSSADSVKGSPKEKKSSASALAAMYAAEREGIAKDFLTPQETRALEEERKKALDGEEKESSDGEANSAEGEEDDERKRAAEEDDEDDDDETFLTEEQKASMTPLREF